MKPISQYEAMLKQQEINNLYGALQYFSLSPKFGGSRKSDKECEVARQNIKTKIRELENKLFYT